MPAERAESNAISNAAAADATAVGMTGDSGVSTSHHQATSTWQPVGLLDIVAAQRPGLAAASNDQLTSFRKATTVRSALEAFFGTPISKLPEREKVIRRLSEAVALIDELVSTQLDAVLHNPRFQQLEAAWRGVDYLTRTANDYGDQGIKIRILNASWREVERDFERAIEFDQSSLFKMVYEHEFGTPGGEPFGVLLADYELHPAPTRDHPHNDIATARSLAKLGAAAFCPVIINASPTMLELDTFGELEQPINHRRTHDQMQYLPWRQLRSEEDSRFLGVAMPHILMRPPYDDDGSRIDGFRYRESVEGPDNSRYLWGGAAFAMGEVLIRAFAQSGWLADIRGLHRDSDRGGLVTGLPVHSFQTDREGIAAKFSTDVVISEELEKEMSDLGFLPLCHCKDTEYAAFLSSQSIQVPKKYDEPVATTNAQISAMLQYMFCVSRFAHYIKVIGRDKVGSFTEPSEFERFLQRWIVNYVTADASASVESKARHPLRDAQVRVFAIPGRPGAYHCTMHLSPHYELDDLNATIKLAAELTPGQPAT